MGWIIATSSLLTVGALVLVLTLGVPLAWLWMLIDALVREERDYPNATATSNNRVMWVLLILLVHITALPYFFLVYLPAHRAAVGPVTPAAVAA